MDHLDRIFCARAEIPICEFISWGQATNLSFPAPIAPSLTIFQVYLVFQGLDVVLPLAPIPSNHPSIQLACCARQSISDWLASQRCHLISMQIGPILVMMRRHLADVSSRHKHCYLITCTAACRHSPGTRAPCTRGHRDRPARYHRAASPFVPGRLLLKWLSLKWQKRGDFIRLFACYDLKRIIRSLRDTPLPLMNLNQLLEPLRALGNVCPIIQ